MSPVEVLGSVIHRLRSTLYIARIACCLPTTEVVHFVLGNA